MKRRGRRCDPRKRRYWESLLRGWKASGRTVREYCRVEGLRESAFYFWRRKLQTSGQLSGDVGQAAATGSRMASAARSPGRPLPPRRGAVSFLPVRVVQDAAIETARGVEIVLGPGRTVRVPAGFDRQTLMDVLAVLEAQPC